MWKYASMENTLKLGKIGQWNEEQKQLVRETNYVLNYISVENGITIIICWKSMKQKYMGIYCNI